MSIVKAKCLKCNAEIEVENNEDAGICPNCGSAYVTEKVIKNYQSGVAEKQPAKSSMYVTLANLADKYNAFISLSKINYSSLLDYYRFRAKIIDKENEVNKKIDNYNLLVSDEEKMRNKYNNRVKGFNDAKYTAGADSLSEKLHRKYVENALKKHGDVESNIKYSQRKVQEDKAVLQNLLNEEKTLSKKICDENFQYYLKAKSIADKMCEDYPSNPLGYLYLADWHKRESKWKKGFFEFARGIYEEDSVVISEIQHDLYSTDPDKEVQNELGKAETFMTDKFNIEYADLIKKLKVAKKPVKSSPKPSAGAKSNTAKNLNSTTAKLTTSKPKTNANTKLTSSSTAKLKSGSEKKRKKKLERKAKVRAFTYRIITSLISWILVLGVLGAIVACVLKFVFHLF